MAYALIHIADPARAAQYAALVEQHRLSATPARSQEEALFHSRRLGQAALLLVEVQGGAEGFELLHKLRKARQTGPALVISGSWALRNEALRLRKQLGIVEVLAASQPLATVQKAVARALGPAGKHKPAPADAPAFPRKAPPTEPQSEQAVIDGLLEQAARSLYASMALCFIDGEDGGQLYGHFGWGGGIVPMVGTPEEWAPFRNLSATAPVDVRRAADDKVLARSPLVVAGTVGSFAGAPLVDAQGKSAGVLWVAHRNAEGLVPDVLHPLTVWAQHLASRLHEIAPAAQKSLAPAPASKEPRLKSSALDVPEALAELLSGVETGFIITDESDRIAYANPAALRLLGLRNRRLTGLMRARIIERLRLHSGLDGRAASKLLRDPAAKALRLELPLHVPGERVLRWESRQLALGDETCRVDEISDITAEVQGREATARLVRVDGLTLLGNLRSFEESLAREISRSLRNQAPLSLALFRIDERGKLPPGVADVVLRDVAWLIADITRGYDHAARFDEETIAVVLPGAPMAPAMRFATRIVEETADLWVKNMPRVTLSGGVAEFDAEADVGVFTSRARAALLEAAAHGGNGVL